MRGAAVLVVLAVHATPSLLIGGWVGVTIFFVLSGFLITNLLIDEWNRHGEINLTAFLGRRARRLVPVLVIFAAAACGAAAFEGTAGRTTLAAWPAALGFATNISPGRD